MQAAESAVAAGPLEQAGAAVWTGATNTGGVVPLLILPVWDRKPVLGVQMVVGFTFDWPSPPRVYMSVRHHKRQSENCHQRKPGG